MAGRSAEPEGACGWGRKALGLAVGGATFLAAIPAALALASPPLDAWLRLPRALPEPLNLVVAPPLISLGLFLTAWSGLVQLRVGEGTPVPAIPTRRLVTSGPYALCRNPMLLGSTVYYLGIGFLLNSISTMMLVALFLATSVVYIKLVEERELEERFGREYVEYKRRTPFLIPSLRRAGKEPEETS